MSLNGNQNINSEIGFVTGWWDTDHCAKQSWDFFCICLLFAEWCLGASLRLEKTSKGGHTDTFLGSLKTVNKVSKSHMNQLFTFFCTIFSRNIQVHFTLDKVLKVMQRVQKSRPLGNGCHFQGTRGLCLSLTFSKVFLRGLYWHWRSGCACADHWWKIDEGSSISLCASKVFFWPLIGTWPCKYENREV